MCFITAPRKIERKVDLLTDRFDRFLDSYETDKHDLKSIRTAIFNGGANGIMQNLEMVAAQCRSNFETSPSPKFICNSKGRNVSVNKAYRELVEVWHDDDIAGTQWMSVIYGELKESYIAEFARCATHGEDFFGDCDFRNPATNAHKGRWKIYAPATKCGDGSYLYVGTFTIALDETAKNIATAYKWNIESIVK